MYIHNINIIFGINLCYRNKKASNVVIGNPCIYLIAKCHTFTIEPFSYSYPRSVFPVLSLYLNVYNGIMFDYTDCSESMFIICYPLTIEMHPELLCTILPSFLTVWMTNNKSLDTSCWMGVIIAYYFEKNLFLKALHCPRHYLCGKI